MVTDGTPPDSVGVAGEHRDFPVRHPHVPDLDTAVHAARRDDTVVVLAPVHAQDLDDTRHKINCSVLGIDFMAQCRLLQSSG